MKNGNLEGKGIYYYKDGNRYEADWKNDNEVKGIYDNNGERYESVWRNDKQERKGILFFKMVIDMKVILKIII